ncbi:unnamed protein product, partial [Lymnaea stagnalis]
STGTAYFSSPATSTPIGTTLASINNLIDRIVVQTESVLSTQDLSMDLTEQEALPVTTSSNLERDDLASSSETAEPTIQSQGSDLNLNQRVDVEAGAEVDTTTSISTSTTSADTATSESIPFNQTLAIVSCVVGFLIASVLMIIIFA